MQETFIKLDRSLLRHRYFDNANVLKVWLWCLMRASHIDHQLMVGMQTVALKSGQFVTGRDAAARDLKMPGSTAWTILKLLEKDGKLDIKSNNKFSVVSLIDYSSYQTQKYKARQQNGQHLDSTLTTDGQHLDTNNKGNNGNKVKKEPKTKPSKFSVPDWVPKDAWDGWLEMRTKKRVPNTDRALKMAINDLDRLGQSGQDLEKVIDKSTIKGWTSFYAIKDDNHGRSGTAGGATQTRVKTRGITSPTDNTIKPEGFFKGDFVDHSDQW